jgi:hypothetical protein
MQHQTKKAALATRPSPNVSPPTAGTFTAKSPSGASRANLGVIRAVLVGCDTATALGITVQASAPVLALCLDTFGATHAARAAAYAARIIQTPATDLAERRAPPQEIAYDHVARSNQDHTRPKAE